MTAVIGFKLKTSLIISESLCSALYRPWRRLQQSKGVIKYMQRIKRT